MWFLLVTQYVPHPQKVQKNNKTSLGTFECSLLQRVQKENTKTSLWTFKCNLIQKVQKEISKSSLGTFKCSLGTYDFEMTTPPPHPYSNPVKSLISTYFTDYGPMLASVEMYGRNGDTQPNIHVQYVL